MRKDEEITKRPRGRPATGRPPKRNMTLRLAPDVAEFLDAVVNKAQTVEEAIRRMGEYKRKRKNDAS